MTIAGFKEETTAAYWKPFVVVFLAALLERTFYEWLEASDQAAYRNIARVFASGVDPISCQYRYDIAHVIRSRELPSRLQALTLFFESTSSRESCCSSPGGKLPDWFSPAAFRLGELLCRSDQAPRKSCLSTERVRVRPPSQASVSAVRQSAAANQPSLS